MRHPICLIFVTGALSVVFAFSGCSGENYPSAATGGVGASLAGATSTGAAAGGTTVASAGNSSTGGTTVSGGFANGGVSGASASGGALSSGGTSFVTGGNSFGSGGAGTSAGSGGSFPVGTGGAGGTAAGANGGGSGAGRSGSAAGGALGGQSGVAGQGGGPQGGATMSGGAGAVSFLEAENIIGNNCAGCHVNRRPIFTTTGTVLHNMLTSTVVKQCGNHKLVVPNDPTNSAIIELVTNKCNGFRMPTSCSDAVCLVPDEFAKLTSWISLGAKSE